MNGFIIKEKLPSLNEVINADRTNRYAGSKLKKRTEQTITMYICRALRLGALKPVESACVITIEWHEQTKKRDVDNIQSSQKFILDALQKAGILPNDNRKYVKQVYHEVVDDDSDFVIVNIEEAEVMEE